MDAGDGGAHVAVARGGPSPKPAVALLVAVAVAWLGLFAHNELSLSLAPLSAENLAPSRVF
jgi:hypothetical protein